MRAEGGISTLTIFDTVEMMKGSSPSRVTVRLPGGRVGHLTAKIDGVPRFSPGEEAIVFLQRTGPADFSVAGWVEGTFRIGRDRTGIESVTQDSTAFAVFDTATRTFRTEGIHRMPMSEFRQRIASSMGRSNARVR